MRRCLLITTSYPAAEPSGAEAAGSFVRDFAVSLASELAVTVIAPSLQGGSAHDSGVRVIYFPVSQLPLSLLSPLKPRDWKAIVDTLREGAKAVSYTHLTLPTNREV